MGSEPDAADTSTGGVASTTAGAGAAGALGGLSVLDASRHFAGQYACRLLADNGAKVVLVESPVDDPTVGRAAYAAGEEPAGDAAVFRHLNLGKLADPGLDLDLDLDGDREILVGRCCASDVAVVSDPALADAIAVASGGRTLVGLVTEFGRSGPYRRWQGSELVHQALSGSMYVNGLQGRPPLYGVGMRAYHAAGSFLYTGLVASLAGRLRGTATGLVEISVHESAAAMEQNFSGQWHHNRSSPQRDEMARPRGRARCRDGWVVYFVRRGQWAAFCRLLDRADMIDDPRFGTWDGLQLGWREAEAELRSGPADRLVADVVAEADERGLILAPMLEPGDQFDDPHLAARGYWAALDWDRSGRPTRALGPVFRLSRTPILEPRPLRPAGDPLTGDTTTTATWSPAGSAPEPAEPPAGGSAAAWAPSNGGGGISRPLNGVRVLDITAAWAGPMATRHLATLGAEVIKVEGPRWVDPWRGEITDPPRTHVYPDGVPGDRPYDRSCWFNSQNHDKSGVVIDNKTPEGRSLLRRLALASDVVLANLTPGALERMGLGYESLAAEAPEVIVVEMPAFGRDGPQAGLKGLGPTMEAMAGLSSLIGYADTGPLGSGSAYLDPVGALNGAAACVTALAHRARSGRGQHVEVAQREAAMHWMGEILLAMERGAAPPVTVGNDRPPGAPHGAYPCRGRDEWIGIDATDDESFVALCRLIGASGLAGDGRYGAAADRWRNRRQLDADLSAATAGHDRFQLASRLQVAGVRAAPVLAGSDLAADPHLAAANWFTVLDHPSAGRHAYAGLPYVIDGQRLIPRRAAPTFGQHNHDVLVGVLGLDDGEQRRLTAAGVLTDVPAPPPP